MTATTIKPWFNSTDTEERNIKAKKAYSGKNFKKFIIFKIINIFFISFSALLCVIGWLF
jgi:hypothetical protein